MYYNLTLLLAHHKAKYLDSSQLLFRLLFSAAVHQKAGSAHTEAMGFGDYLNDMSLLESCGESYCMKNGHPTLKALAKYVTEKTNDENGVMEVLNTL